MDQEYLPCFNNMVEQNGSIKSTMLKTNLGRKLRCNLDRPLVPLWEERICESVLDSLVNRQPTPETDFSLCLMFPFLAFR